MVSATSTRRSFADDVREIDEFFAVLVARIDPDAVPLSEVTDLWTALDAVERRAAATKLLLARKVEEAGRWKRGGYRSAADQLAGIAGTSLTAAKNQLETSKKLRKRPATARALRAGKLSAAKAEAIAAAAEVAPEAEEELLDGAEDVPLADIREKCMKARAKDRDAAHERIRKARAFKEFTDTEGAWNVIARGTVEAGRRVPRPASADRRGDVQSGPGRGPPRALRGLRVRRVHRARPPRRERRHGRRHRRSDRARCRTRPRTSRKRRTSRRRLRRSISGSSRSITPRCGAGRSRVTRSARSSGSGPSRSRSPASCWVTRSSSS